MLKYLKRLDEFEDFHEFTVSSDFAEPNVTVLDDGSVFYNDLATDLTNPELMDIARGAGWVESGATALTYANAFSITTEQFNAANVIVADSSAPNGYNVTFKNLVHFEEFEYFLGVTGICKTDETSSSHGGFYNATKLETIKLPSSLVSIGDYAFYECNALTGITFPDSVKETGLRSFWGCINMKDVHFNEGIERFGKQGFVYSMSQAHVELPSSTKIIERQTFCHNLPAGYGFTMQENLVLPDIEEFGFENFLNGYGPRTLSIGENLEIIGEGPDYRGEFDDVFWPQLESVSISASNPYNKSVDNLYVYSKDGKLFYGGAQYGLSKLETIEVEEGCEVIMPGALRNMERVLGPEELIDCPWVDSGAVRYNKLIFPSTVTYIGNRAGQYMSNYDLVCKAVVPPTCMYSSFYMTARAIYVPDESVEAYKTATPYWSAVKNKIKPMSELPTN